jgi:hypothetical protein
VDIRRQPGTSARRLPPTCGVEGNARLTAATAVVLLVLPAVEGLTLLSLQTFLSWHIFVGMLLVPVVGLKLGSTGYRFVRYYAGRRAYVEAGPPPTVLRLLGPLVIAATLALFATGVTLAAVGPGDGIVLGLHKASFIVWVGAMSVHVLAHVFRIPRLVGPDLRGGRGLPGARLRLGIVASAVCAGAVVALATLPLIAPWTHWVGRH